MINETSQAGRLSEQIDIIAMPRKALKALGNGPDWLLSILITGSLCTIGFFMQRPAQLHAQTASMSRLLDGLSSRGLPEAQRLLLMQMVQPGVLQTSVALLGVWINVFLGVLASACMLYLSSVALKGSATFRQLWGGSALVALPTVGLLSVTLGAICLLIGPEHFSRAADLQLSVPGLASLPFFDDSGSRVVSGITAFSVWAFILNWLMMREIAGMRGVIAWVGPAVLLASQASLTAWLLTPR
jgi:hypothetical protein